MRDLSGARLRETLDHLRISLSSAMMGSLPAPEPREYQELAHRLHPFFQRLEALDLGLIISEASLSGLSSLPLLELFEHLHRGLKAFVKRTLGEEKIELLVYLLSSSSPDVLHILGKTADENAHSNLIAWLLDPRRAPRVARHALRRLTSYLPEPPDHPDLSWRAHVAEAVATESLSVRREVLIARDFEDANDLRRVDIVISSPRFMLVIENKVWSREHTDQTCAYWDWLQSMRGLRGGILLSPSGEAASCPDFSAISYLDLVSCLLEGPLSEPLTATEEFVLASYLKTLAREILQVEMRVVLELAIEKERI